MRLIRNGGGGRGYGRGGKGRLYTCHYTVTTRMTSALRWAAMRAILIFHNCEGQSHETVSSDHNFWRERRAEADLNWSPTAYHPNALLLGQTGSHAFCLFHLACNCIDSVLDWCFAFWCTELLCFFLFCFYFHVLCYILSVVFCLCYTMLLSIFCPLKKIKVKA